MKEQMGDDAACVAKKLIERARMHSMWIYGPGKWYTPEEFETYYPVEILVSGTNRDVFKSFSLADPRNVIINAIKAQQQDIAKLKDFTERVFSYYKAKEDRIR